ncbi:MAG: sugar phosphate isomerase/epimerase and 4-hydroxyphenylpyruvate domain-containing protein [Gammaproteobacteria bacterium]|nr:sugar phosphate isomerase/epimerase and 4-hydroxyphenylpyruvate domain-containing protein [Gammaproteobacteria bacterium]MDH5302877.1 sugar phosphate isomerase/epimerase and 4-hydroxyphenylpyruvate domain-containing protein [Gammaproteobacteria bacterium]MDH5320982.1 sugar phosphate isomerase/epimerase and 4-hydroxyphenylpyruvate domain-containing protein [Gammaproteobacteria bacterium]
MRRSIAAVALGGGLQEKLYAIAAARFDSVELTEAELAFSEMQPREIKQLLDEVGLTISVFHSITDVEGVSARTFSESLARAERKFELMGELGATLLRIPSNAGGQALDNPDIAAEQLAALADRAQVQGIRIGYEAIATARFVTGYLQAWKILAAAGHANLGLILDSVEVLAKGDDPALLATIPGERIFMVQLADAPALAIDLETLGRHFRCFPGQGALDVSGFAACVLDSGYAGPFSLDVRNDVVRAAPVRSAALDGYRSLTFVEEQLFRLGRKTSRSAFAGSDPPAQQQEESIGFIEFAVDSESQQELETWLGNLGFRRAGTHRSKDVVLYQQGGVLIVLNAGSDTFAHYYHHLHGTTICAIGLRLSDPLALLARADLYAYKRYEERVGPQEYMMPAVRAPDGSLLHLLDPRYDPHTDFVMDNDSDAPASILDRVDHLVRAVPENQFDSWVLFYRALLGLTADNSLDLSDPHGTVRSRALHDADNRLRMPLTYSDNAKTVVALSLSSFGGAGINQIAFETSDIFAAVAEMRKRGMPLLSIPANYYRDLAENRDVPMDLVEKMKKASVLYDCDPKGRRFFHVYTEFFNNRFFFEVVQRENGYDGYGECNAPVRMAAQAKHQQRRGMRQADEARV